MNRIKIFLLLGILTLTSIPVLGMDHVFRPRRLTKTFKYYRCPAKLQDLAIQAANLRDLESKPMADKLRDYALDFKKNAFNANLKADQQIIWSTNKRTPGSIQSLIYLDNIPAMQHLLEHTDLTPDIFNQLIAMADQYYPVMIPLLIEAGAQQANFSFFQRYPLHAAVLFENGDAVKALANDERVNVTNNLGLTAFEFAAQYNKTRMLEELMAYASNAVKNKALHLAIDHNATDVIKMLVTGGADVNAITTQDGDCRGFTTFQKVIACFVHKSSEPDSTIRELKDLVKTANVLLELGADVNKKNLYKKTALHVLMADYRWNLPIIQLLIDRGANINERTGDGKTTLDTLFLEQLLTSSVFDHADSFKWCLRELVLRKLGAKTSKEICLGISKKVFKADSLK